MQGRLDHRIAGCFSKDKPVPSIIDWTMVDTNKDAMIDADEFKAGCAAGWIVPAS